MASTPSPSSTISLSSTQLPFQPQNHPLRRGLLFPTTIGGRRRCLKLKFSAVRAAAGSAGSSRSHRVVYRESQAQNPASIGQFKEFASAIVPPAIFIAVSFVLWKVVGKILLPKPHKASTTENKPASSDMKWSFAAGTNLLKNVSQKIERDSKLKLDDFAKELRSFNVVDMSGRNFGDEGLFFLAESLAYNQVAEEVDFSANGITSAGVKAFDGILQSNIFLKTLNLSGNTIGDEGAKCLCEVLANNSGIEKLQLNSTGLEDEGAKAVAEMLKKNTTLRIIELNNNMIDYSGFASIAGALLEHSYRKSGHPGPITRLLSCTEEEKKRYRGFDLAPTMEVPSMSRHPRTGDWYPAINKPAGVLYWLQHSEDARNVDWVVILDADMIIRGPIVPWELGAEKGRPVSQYYGYLIGCDNILAKLHTKHPELCDKVGGLLVFHIDDLRAVAPFWLSKSEEVREDRAHWATNITGDIDGTGWISEMYGYSFGAAEVGLSHKITNDLMIYPGYVPRDGVEPILLHYGLPFAVGNWSFTKLDHHQDGIVYDCGRLFPEPPYPREVKVIEADPGKRRGLMLSIECMNTLNEALLHHHIARGCPKPKWTRYLSFLKSRTHAELTKPKYPGGIRWLNEKDHEEELIGEAGKPYPKIHTIFSTECTPYFDWQTVGFMHSFRLSGQPGNVTRLLSCTDEDLKHYSGHDLAPTHYVPSMSVHPFTGDRYPAINKPAAVVHWINHAQIDAEYIVILDADMIMRGEITPWEFKAARGRPVSAPYGYLIGCDNILAKLHTRNPEACDKVGGVIIMHIEDLRKFSMYWLLKTQEVRADTEHYSTNITGDIYEAGWISEMYGYSFGAAELNLRHRIDGTIMMYPGYAPQLGVNYRVFHYGLVFKVGDWTFDKAKWRDVDLVNKCWAKFPDPPDPSNLDRTNEDAYYRDLLSIECGRTLNDALYLHHKNRNCPDPSKLATLDEVVMNKEKIYRKFRNIIESDATRNSSNESNDSPELLTPPASNQFSSIRIWLMVLWGACFLGFVSLLLKVYVRGKKRKSKGKHYKSKKRSSYSALHDLN